MEGRRIYYNMFNTQKVLYGILAKSLCQDFSFSILPMAMKILMNEADIKSDRVKI